MQFILVLVFATALTNLDTFQPYNGSKFDHLTLRDGLSHSTVTGIVKDQTGYIWIATRDGLNKYDGYEIEIFKPDRANSEGLTDGWIHRIVIDSQGLIWLGTYNSGIFQFDPKQKKFSPHSTSNSDLIDDRIFDLHIDHRDRLWIATDKGLQIYDPQVNQFTTYLHEEDNEHSLIQNYVSAIHVVDDNEVWLGYWGSGISKFNPVANTFKHFNTNNSGLSSDLVRALEFDNDLNLWIGTASGLNRLNTEAGDIRRWFKNSDPELGMSDNSVRDLLMMGDDNLWIATDDGLNKLNFEEDRFTIFKSNPYVQSSIGGNVIFSLFEDETQTLWIGTLNSGLSRLDPARNKFHHHTYSPIDDKSISDPQVHTFYENSDGNIWIGSQTGVDLWNREEGTFDRLFSAGSLVNERITSILEDDQNRMWIATRGNGLYRSDPGKSDFTQLLYADKGFFVALINFLFEDSSNRVWIATHADGLFYYESERNDFINVPLNSPLGLENRVNYIYEDQQNEIWVATYSSLIRIKDNKLVSSYINKNGEQRLHDVTAVTVRLGEVWIGTSNNGICVLQNKDTDFFECFNELDGLPNNSVAGMLTDKSGYIWVSTKNGISRFNPDQKKFRNYSENDGLQDIEFNVGSAFKTSDYEFFFGGINGFNHFYPSEIKDPVTIPTVVIRDINILSKSDSSVYEPGISSEINLKSDENFFTISFSVLDFTDPENNLFQYKMEGLDTDWSVASNRNFATYTNVPPGTYTFKLRGASSDGVWNNTGIERTITVIPPFWQTRWFIGLLASALLFIAFLIIQYRERNFRTMKVRLEHMVAERTESMREQTKELLAARKEADKANKAKSEFLAGISHELRTPLNAIIGFSQILSKDATLSGTQQHYAEVMQKSGAHLLEMINDVLDISKVESGQVELHKQNFLLQDVLMGIISMFTLACQQKGLKLEYNLSENLPQQIYSDVGKIRQIQINLLGNAVKFTNSGTIRMDVEMVSSSDIDWYKSENDQDLLQFTISDTGRGMSSEDVKTIYEPFKRTGDQRNTGTGLGLTISKKLVEIMDGAINVDSKLGKGTTFKWVMPFEISHDHPNADQSAKLTNIIGLKPAETFNILAVDDNEDNSELVKSILESNGMRCFCVSSGEDAIPLYKKIYPNLVLMDISLPGISGIETARRIKKISGDSIPIVAVTAGVFNDHKEPGSENVFDGIVLKPFDQSELLLEIAKHLKVKVLFEKSGPGMNQQLLNELEAAIEKLPDTFHSDFKEALELTDFDQMEEIVNKIDLPDAEFTKLKKAIQDKEYTLIISLSERLF